MSGFTMPTDEDFKTFYRGYDALTQDPSGFFRSVYLPRIFGALEPFKMLAPLPNILELPFTGGNLLQYGHPEVQTAVRALLEAGSEALKWVGVLGAFDKEMAEAGFPNIFGGAASCRFHRPDRWLTGIGLHPISRQNIKSMRMFTDALDIFVHLFCFDGCNG